VDQEGGHEGGQERVKVSRHEVRQSRGDVGPEQWTVVKAETS
jgi:hypothetical protein